MFPNSVTGIYRQYKKDTDYVASWLARNAQKCGFALSSVPGSNDHEMASNPVKLKGRARMLAKRQAKISQQGARIGPGDSSCALTPKPKYTVAIKDFLPMAHLIVSSTCPLIDIPIKLVESLDRAISLRTAVGQNFALAAEQHGTGDAANNQHTHFIGVLEAVREILKPCMPSRPATMSAPATTHASDSDLKSLDNMFANLVLEECNDVDAKDDTEISGCLPAQPQYVAEKDKDDVLEVYCAFICLLHDFKATRSTILEIWVEFKTGRLDLIAAALTTDVALELARQLEAEQQSMFDTYGGSFCMLRMTYAAYCVMHGCDLDEDLQPDDKMNSVMDEAAYTFMWPAARILEMYKQLLEPGTVPWINDETLGKYDPKADRKSMSLKQRFQEDKVILFQILPDFLALTFSNDSAVPDDFLTRGLREMFATSQISLSLILAAQTLLSIHHVLRADVGMAFQQLCEIGDAACESMQLTFDNLEALGLSNRTAITVERLQQILQTGRTLCQDDPFGSLMSKLQSSHSRPTTIKHRLMKSHPVRCGLAAYVATFLSQRVGIALANAGQAVWHCAHLYNALRQEKLLQQPWPDMEVLLGIQDETHIFVGERPYDAQGYVRRFLLSNGLSASNFARNQSRHVTLRGLLQPRKLQEMAQCLRMFNRDHADISKRMNITLDDIEKILEKSGWHKLEVVTGISNSDISEKANNIKPEDRVKKSKHLGHRGSLLALKNCLQSEIFEFSFDYLQLHRECWHLLKKIDLFTAEHMRKDTGIQYVEVGTHLPALVEHIFFCLNEDDQMWPQIDRWLERTQARASEQNWLQTRSLLELTHGRTTGKQSRSQYLLKEAARAVQMTIFEKSEGSGIRMGESICCKILSMHQLGVKPAHQK